MGGNGVVLDILDAPGEWLLDEANDKLYLYTTDGTSPANHTVRVKQRTYGFYTDGFDYIELKGLDFFGTTARFQRGDGSIFDDLELDYPSFSLHLRENDEDWQDVGTAISGSNLKIANSKSRYASNFGFMVTSEFNEADTNSVIENSLVENASWFGDHNNPGIGMAPFHWRGDADGFVARNNTVRNVGAIGILCNI